MSVSVGQEIYHMNVTDLTIKPYTIMESDIVDCVYNVLGQEGVYTCHLNKNFVYFSLSKEVAKVIVNKSAQEKITELERKIVSIKQRIQVFN